MSSWSRSLRISLDNFLVICHTPSKRGSAFGSGVIDVSQSSRQPDIPNTIEVVKSRRMSMAFSELCLCDGWFRDPRQEGGFRKLFTVSSSSNNYTNRQLGYSRKK